MSYALGTKSTDVEMDNIVAAVNHPIVSPNVIMVWSVVEFDANFRIQSQLACYWTS